MKNYLPANNWLQKKTVFITGASSGIGRELALLFYSNGSKIIAHGRSKEHLDALMKSARKKNIGFVVGDLRKENGMEAVESAILEKKPDVLILNAGYNVRKEFVSGWTDSEVTEMMNVNFISPIRCARSFTRLPQLNEPRRLAIILSTSCHFVREKMGLYVAAKTGLMGFGKVLQQEAKELGVRTILFYPGRTNTGFREKPKMKYMDPKSVAIAVATILCLPIDLVPYEFTFRPDMDTYI